MSRSRPVLLASLMVLAPLATAETVVDDFTNNANPNNWAWTNIFDPITVIPTGGNPGGWADTGVPYFAQHANFTALPPAGSPLRAALDSTQLHGASIDLQRFDTTGVPGCLPANFQASFVSLTLVDEHSGDFSIEGRTTSGPEFPVGPFSWLTASFTIPSDATDTPPGWELVNPNDIPYTWADLMHNLDAIGFYVGNPDQHSFSACTHLGADNAVISYGEEVFANGFDAPN